MDYEAVLETQPKTNSIVWMPDIIITIIKLQIEILEY